MILDRLLRGYSIPDIAERELISDSTVRTHYRNIYAKLGIHSKAELIELAENSHGEKKPAE